MKTLKLFAPLAAAFALGVLPLAGPLSAAPAPDGKLSVTFQNWQKFTDIKDRFDPTDAGEQGILKELENALQRDAKSAVPKGDHLDLVFTDIDLAGEFEPERGPQFDDIRIVKDIYPPRFVFDYTLTDGSGKIVKSGHETLLDMSFQMRITLDREDPLHYEKDILKDWMSRKMHEK